MFGACSCFLMKFASINSVPLCSKADGGYLSTSTFERNEAVLTANCNVISTKLAETTNPIEFPTPQVVADAFVQPIQPFLTIHLTLIFQRLR